MLSDSSGIDMFTKENQSKLIDIIKSIPDIDREYNVIVDKEGTYPLSSTLHMMFEKYIVIEITYYGNEGECDIVPVGWLDDEFQFKLI